MRKHNISDRDRLLHIAEAAEFIISHTNISEAEFYRDSVLKRAVVRDLEVIGEAANFLSKELTSQHLNIPWEQIIATRHRIIHEYFDVNYTTVWNIVKQDIPVLKKQIDHILQQET